MEIFSALLAICAGNSPVPGEFPTQRPVTPSFDVYFDLRPNKRLGKQSWGWWFETPSHPFWRHRSAQATFAFRSLFTSPKSDVHWLASGNQKSMGAKELVPNADTSIEWVNQWRVAILSNRCIVHEQQNPLSDWLFFFSENSSPWLDTPPLDYTPSAVAVALSFSLCLSQIYI